MSCLTDVATAVYNWYVWLSWYPLDWLNGYQSLAHQNAIVTIAGVWHRIIIELPHTLLITYVVLTTADYIENGED